MNIPNIEALKEVARWAVFFAIGWVITETLNQLSVIPETYQLHVWELVYTLPIRLWIQVALTFLGRYVDKYIFVKTFNDPTVKTKGLLPF
jgi:hypothetical protein